LQSRNPSAILGALMIWALQAGVLLVVAVVLRRILHMGREIAPQEKGPRHRKLSHPVYSSLTSEIEAHTTILGVLLNDAIEEQNSGNTELARRTLHLFDSERQRVVDLVINLQNLALKYLPAALNTIVTRTLSDRSFRSAPVSDLIRRQGNLEQFVFRSKLRFQLQLRLLRRATAILNESFEEIKRDAEANSKLIDWALAQIDLHLYDLDVLARETLLGFDAELASMPRGVMQELADEVIALTSRSSVLKTLVPAAHQQVR
jgi:hypothetical protein